MDKMRSISRRKFLKSIAAIPVAGLVANSDGISLQSIRHPSKIPIASSPITVGNHPRELWPGVKEWFGEKYKEDMANTLIMPEDLCDEALECLELELGD